MAIEKCKECGANISDKAKQCPSCGNPIKRTSFVTKLIAGLIVSGVLISVVETCSMNNQKEEAATAEAARVAALSPAERAAIVKSAAEATAKKEARDTEVNAVYACMAFIKKNLKDPDSAQFEYSGEQAPSHKDKHGIYQVQQKVRAKNSFGAKIISIFDCSLQQTSDGKSWILIKMKELN